MPEWAARRSAAAIGRLQPRQCVVNTRWGLFSNFRTAPAPALWIDNLYFVTLSGWEVAVMDLVREARHTLWLSRVVHHDTYNDTFGEDGPERSFLTLYGTADVLVTGASCLCPRGCRLALRSSGGRTTLA